MLTHEKIVLFCCGVQGVKINFQNFLQTQDRFHEEDAKELRRLRSGMAALAKTCRAFHLKLKKAERKSGELKIKNDELKAAVKSGASLESSSSR